MKVIIILFIVFIIIPNVFYYIMHLIDSINSCACYDFADFNTFLNIIGKYKEEEWNINYSEKIIRCYKNPQDVYPSLLFNLDKTDIYIENKQMVLNPIDYLKYRRWLYINTRKKSNRVKGLWKENYE